jgi:hypothetical protein
MRVQPDHGLMGEREQARLLLPPIGVYEDHQGFPNMGWHRRPIDWLSPGAIPIAAVIVLIMTALIAAVVAFIIRSHVSHPAILAAVEIEILRRCKGFPTLMVATPTHALRLSRHSLFPNTPKKVLIQSL